MNRSKKGANMSDSEGTQIVELPLSVIKVDLDWNSRNKLSVLQEGSSGTEDEETGKMTTDELGASIEARGQDTPVHVVPNPDKKDRKFTHVLIAGFKRYTAMHRLAERSLHNKNLNPIQVTPSWSAKNPTILAKVDNLTESDARMLNMRENTARANLTVPDTAFGIHNIYEALKKEGKEIPSDTALAAGLGIGQSYVSKCRKILGAVMPIKQGEILKNWREARKPLPLNDMLKVVSQATPDRIWEAYSEKVGARAAEDKDEPADPNAWMEKAKENAEKVGIMVGVLQSLDQIEGGNAIEWQAVISDLIPIKKGADVKQILEIGRTAQNGFLHGLKKLAEDKADEARKASEKEAAKIAKKNAKEDEATAKAAEGTKNGKAPKEEGASAN